MTASRNGKKVPKKAVALNFIIPLVIYPFDLMVSIGQTDAQVLLKLKQFGLEKEDPEQWQYTGPTNIGRAAILSNNASFLRLRSLPSTPRDFGCLAHEIFHVATFVMYKVGIKFKVLQSDEAYAYLVGYITEQIYKRTNKYY